MLAGELLLAPMGQNVPSPAMDQRPDVIVIGAALNGLATALALGGQTARRPLRVMVVDAKDPHNFATSTFDGRASAITSAARRMFEALGIWDSVSTHAQAMDEIVVTDSDDPQRRPTLLTFERPDQGGSPTAHMIENRILYASLLRQAEVSSHISFAVGHAVTQYRFQPGLAHITLGDGSQLQADLIVAADGRHSPARDAAGIRMVGWPYDQAGLVATVEHDLPHRGRAEEHFTPKGPFAILPLTGNRSSLVWTESLDTASHLMALDDSAFLAELRHRFGAHLGGVRLISGRHSYPLGLFVAETFHAPRLALVGDAAHVLHPLAGLGFNLGLRDVAALAETLHDATGLGQDIGSAAVLERYTVWRRFDTVATAAAMDGMNRLFSSANPALKLLRQTGLRAVDRIGSLKSLFAAEAAGTGGNIPRLLRGDSL